MRARTIATLSAIAAAVALFAVSGGAAVGAQEKSTYIIQMSESPVVAYDGEIAGFKATRAAKGAKIDPLSAVVTKYVGYLKGAHATTLAKVGGAEKLYDYFYTYNGVAAKLTEGQVVLLQKQPNVLAVTAEETVTQDTSSTPSFLGLDAPGGLWAQLGGPTGDKNTAGAGEGIVIGVVDSGIWPESKSFTDRDANGKLSFQQIPGWNGKCTPGEAFTASDCNQKLIGGQHFNASWGGDAALEAQRPWEFMSVRDYNGHGTHTASTSGGNYAVPTTGPSAGFGSVSGMAPRARVAAYKALWSTEDASTASGQTGDLVAAIDQAVADGVDVINYSISGTQTNFMDPVMVAYLFAADAGIFVSASAGNSGPASSTVAHPGPWVTTVAAGTHNRNGSGSVTLGNAVTYAGASVASAIGPVGLVDSVNAGLPLASPAQVELCYPGTLNSAVVTGKIVICKRGVIARTDKSRAVAEAGGVGMVLYNSPDSSLNADFHFVPTVHVNLASGTAIKAYAATPGATAKINAATLTSTDPAPFTASFSSRGPLQAGGGDLLKPDVIAPGQDILAAVAPPGNAGRDFNLYSGTSMSAPHVAGLAALLKQRHPDWSPMAIKSALMTSAYDVLDSTSTEDKIFRQGAGHVRPNSAADPGLVYDAGWNDWRGLLRSQKLCTFCFGTSPAPVFDASDYNGASIAIGDLAGVQTVTRRVTNVGGAPATYTPAVTGMAGITTVVSPSSLALSPGQTGSFTVTFTRTTAPLNAYTGGQLTWSDGTHNVRIPLIVRPVALAAPASVSGTGGAINYNVTFGYTGSFSATARGLIPATTFAGSVADDPTDNFVPGGPGQVAIPVTVPAGTTYARFSLFDAFVSPASDIDLYVYLGATLVGGSGSGTSAEEVSLVNPAAGNYTVYVHGWGVPGTASFTLFRWLLDSTAAGNLTVTAPGSATTGSTGAIGLTFSGLVPATKYLGSVAYAGSTGMPNPTIVRVDTP